MESVIRDIIIAFLVGILVHDLDRRWGSVSRRLVKLAALLVPRAERERYRAEWVDFVCSAGEQGLSPLKHALSIALWSAPQIAVGNRYRSLEALLVARRPLIVVWSVDRRCLDDALARWLKEAGPSEERQAALALWLCRVARTGLHVADETWEGCVVTELHLFPSDVEVTVAIQDLEPSRENGIQPRVVHVIDIRSPEHSYWQPSWRRPGTMSEASQWRPSMDRLEYMIDHLRGGVI